MAKKQRSSGGTPATVALTAAGIAFSLHPYDHDPRGEAGYGVEAAAALGLDPARVFKTLMTTVDGRLTTAVVPVSGQLDLKALARALGAGRAAMAEVAAAERATGYVAGGISPIGQRRRHRDRGRRERARPPHRLRLRRAPRPRPRARPGRPGRGHRGEHRPDPGQSVVIRSIEWLVPSSCQPVSPRPVSGSRFSFTSGSSPASSASQPSPASKLTKKIDAAPSSRTTSW